VVLVPALTQLVQQAVEPWRWQVQQAQAWVL